MMRWVKRLLVGLIVGAVISVLVPTHSLAASNCLKIKKWYPKQVLKANEQGTGKLKFVAAKAVKSPDFQSVFFVAIKFKAIGISPTTGVWAVSGTLPQRAADLKGMTLAIDSTAQMFTVWPKGDLSSAKISKADPSVSAVRACLR